MMTIRTRSLLCYLTPVLLGAVSCVSVLKPPPPTIVLVAEYALVGIGASGLCTDESDNFYVSDPEARMVRKYSPSGELLFSYPSEDSTVLACGLTRFGPTGLIGYQAKRGSYYVTYPESLAIRSFRDGYAGACLVGGLLARPLGIAVDDDDNVFVADYGRGKVLHYKLEYDFTYVSDLDSTPGGVKPDLVSPVGIATTSEGLVYVTDAGGGAPAASRVVVYRSDGQFVRSFGREGPGDGELRGPEGVAVDSRGRVLVCDTGNSRVAVFDRNARWIGKFGTRGPARGQFLYAQAIATTRDETFLVLDPFRARVLRLRIVPQVFDH